MTWPNLPRPAALLFSLFFLGGCQGVQNDGYMFQHWAEAVAAIPISAEDAAARRQTGPAMEVKVVDPLDLPAARAAGLRAAVAIAEPVLSSTVKNAGAVQLASFHSVAEAQAAWGELQARHAALRGLEPSLETVDLGSKGTWIRLKAGPVPADQAPGLCRSVGIADRWCAAAARG